MRRSILLFLGYFLFFQLPAQTSLSGIINQYTSVVSYDSCLSVLTVADASSFTLGDQVLIIQMQGASIDESNSASFGTITNLGAAGLFEKAQITEITNNEIFLENRLLHQYDYAGSVQLVSFPRFDNATITGEVTGEAWNGTTGGVIALEVSGQLTMNADINASGLGFRGGQVNILNSNCQWFLNEDNYFYSATNWRGAAKGEGIVPIISGKEAGRGAQANGGGGGNDHNSGGGGGSNISTGGQGGEQTPTSTFQCQGEFPGRGGKALSLSQQRMFLGGGGGSGHADNTGAGSPGGNGGGIVIIIANDLDGQDNFITANGADAPFAPGDGAGGGGGAGSILIEAPNVLSLYSVEAKGGGGGSTQNFSDRCFGPGGGGSGGHLLLNTIFFPITDLEGGQAGENTVASNACGSLNNGAANGQEGVQTIFSAFPSGNIPVDKISILDQPAINTLACTDELLNLSITASGSDLEYQWQLNTGAGFIDITDGGLYSGAQTATLTIDPIDGSLAGYQFQCLIQNDCFSEQPPATTLFIESVPVVNFSSQLLSGTTVQFENLSQFGGSVVWDFGDGTGNQSTVTNPMYTFPADGTYNVTLQVQNDCGVEAITLSINITSAPSSNFTTDIQNGCAPLEVLFTSLASNNTDSLSWDFPGGTPSTATSNTVVVTYETPGTYNASLIAINDAGADTLSMSEEIIAEGPPEADFSVSIDELTIVFQNNTFGGTSYQWDFGDQNTSMQETPTHVYTDNGVYVVTLIATNDCGQDTSVQTVTTGVVPEANFIAEATGGCAPLSINFIDLSQGSVTSRTWSFPGGDPSTSTDSTVLVTYNMPGVYDVSLIAINATAADTILSTELIEVFDQPVASFTFTQDGATVLFTNTSTGTGLSYEWDFGDNSSVSNEENPAHLYTENGTYEIVLTVSNPFCSGLASNFIEIEVNGVQEASLQDQIKLAPNPTTDNIWVEIPTLLVPQIKAYRLIDVSGQQLYRGEVNQARIELSLDALPAGIYYLHVLSEKEVVHLPVVKQ